MIPVGVLGRVFRFDREGLRPLDFLAFNTTTQKKGPVCIDQATLSLLIGKQKGGFIRKFTFR